MARVQAIDRGGRSAITGAADLGEGLFELRFILGSTSRRITYRFTNDARIVLLTTFRKQRQNERNEIARTKNRLGAMARVARALGRHLVVSFPIHRAVGRAEPLPPECGDVVDRLREHQSVVERRKGI